jgi:hypothetical protein
MTDNVFPAAIVPFPIWTLVRTPEGVEFIIEEFISAADSEDETAFYWGSNSGGGTNNIDHNHDGLTVVKTVEELNARQLPTLPDLASALADALGDIGDSIGLDLNEADHSAQDGTVEFVGRTHDGLNIAFTVQITGVREIQL